MPSRVKTKCRQPGCHILIESPGYCEKHIKQKNQLYDKQRGTAHQRGYTKNWGDYSKAFRARPDNQFCVLNLPGCTGFAECVDHIDPVNGPDDPKFWNESNHQPACNHCNRRKGKRYLKGTNIDGN